MEGKKRQQRTNTRIMHDFSKEFAKTTVIASEKGLVREVEIYGC